MLYLRPPVSFHGVLPMAPFKKPRVCGGGERGCELLRRPPGNVVVEQPGKPRPSCLRFCEEAPTASFGHVVVGPSWSGHV